MTPKELPKPKGCKRCQDRPVYVLQNHRKLCKNCFIKYFEKKVLKTIRVYKLIDKKDRIVCAISGGKDSLTCLHILNKVCQPQGIPVHALAIDEGIEGYRNVTIEDAKKFCTEYNTPLKILSVKKEFGHTLDEFLKLVETTACTACGTFRRYLMNKGARELNATKLATGHNLDDESQTLLMNQFKGNMQLSAKLGPVTGVIAHEKFVPRIKPLYFMTEKEIKLYTILKNFPVTFVECPNFPHTFRNKVGEMLNDLELRLPGAKQGIINAFLDVLPELKEKYKKKKIGNCESCGEPAARQFCKACELLEKKLT